MNVLNFDGVLSLHFHLNGDKSCRLNVFIWSVLPKHRLNRFF